MASSGGGGDPNAWLGLLKWSLTHQDGTAPSEARPMSDQDRAWLEKVVQEGVRDDVKAMTEIYGRLCAYLDDLASSTVSSGIRPSQSSSSAVPERRLLIGGSNDQLEANGNDHRVGGINNQPSQQPIAGAASAGMLSTYLAPSVVPVEAGRGGVEEGGEGVGGVGMAGEEERLESVLNDLEELQDIVEQIDMAQTFAKIGGFGRLIALTAPASRPEKLRRRAASVVATLTKNNPPAQAAFSSSGGQRSLLEAVTASLSVESGDAVQPSPAVRLALLHALSCSVMGNAASEDALCSEARFQEFIAGALSQTGDGEESVDQEEEDDGGMAGARLRSKAAFVLKALVGAPGARAARVEALWPAFEGLLTGLEALSTSGPGDDPAAARETCIEALLAAARSAGGERVVGELGPRVSSIMARRRQVLVEGGLAGSVLSPVARSPEDEESSAVELGLWMDWERLSGPAQ